MCLCVNASWREDKFDDNFFNFNSECVYARRARIHAVRRMYFQLFSLFHSIFHFPTVPLQTNHLEKIAKYGRNSQPENWKALLDNSFEGEILFVDFFTNQR